MRRFALSTDLALRAWLRSMPSYRNALVTCSSTPTAPCFRPFWTHRSPAQSALIRLRCGGLEKSNISGLTGIANLLVGSRHDKVARVKTAALGSGNEREVRGRLQT